MLGRVGKAADEGFGEGEGSRVAAPPSSLADGVRLPFVGGAQQREANRGGKMLDGFESRTAQRSEPADSPLSMSSKQRVPPPLSSVFGNQPCSPWSRVGPNGGATSPPLVATERERVRFEIEDTVNFLGEVLLHAGGQGRLGKTVNLEQRSTKGREAFLQPRHINVEQTQDVAGQQIACRYVLLRLNLVRKPFSAR